MIAVYMRRGRRMLQQLVLDPRVQTYARTAGHVLAGFCLSGASLEQRWLTLAPGLVWACRGWEAIPVTLGALVGYRIFWGAAGYQGMLLTGIALLGTLLLGCRRIGRELPLLIPAAGMLAVSATGLGAQLLVGDTTPVAVYLLRVVLGGAAPWLFIRTAEKGNPLLGWLCRGLFALGLAQMLPLPWLGLGYVAVGAAAAGSAFPCGAIVGLALDLSRITPVSMTAVAVLTGLVRLSPRLPGWLRCLCPGLVGIGMMRLWGVWDPAILPGLLLGGTAGALLGRKQVDLSRRGETGTAQVRLEMAAGVLGQTRRLLEQVEQIPVDTDGLVNRAVAQACGSCPLRKNCRETRRMEQLSGQLLQKPLLIPEEIPIRCRKGGRLLAELRRAQEQLRLIRADRQRQETYHRAVVQQYAFLSTYLQDLSDRLCRHNGAGERVYDPVIWVYGNRSSRENADRCLQFAGVGNIYYIVLCDGMGTGPGAVREGKTAAELLKGMLSCGFPPEAALESLDSFCALGQRTGSVTVDLVGLELDTGKGTLYKWGAAPSWLVTGSGAEKLGQTGCPPGMGQAQSRCHVKLRKEQLLLLTSDGVSPERVQECCRQQELTPAGLARKILSCTGQEEDDATVVTVQLLPVQN